MSKNETEQTRLKKQGYNFNMNGRFEEALSAYEGALHIDPNDTTALIGKGDALYYLSRYEDALTSFDKALQIAPNEANGHLGRGNALWGLNRPEAAVAAYDSALKIDDANAITHYNRGCCLLMLNSYEEALAAFDAALQIDPDETSAINGRGNALIWLNRCEEALACYDKSLQKDPSDSTAHSGRGNALYWLGQYEEALLAYDNALQIDPTDATTLSMQESAREMQNAHNPQTFNENMMELESMIGLNQVKRQVKRLISRMQLRKSRHEHGLSLDKISLHLIFTGNPGTGKTTVARILGSIFHGIGLLEKGHVVETSSVDLIAGYVGQTAIQVKEKVMQAMGGILFIDEAYGLIGHETSSGSDFGAEAINTLLKLMEDYRDKFIVIAAGYKNEMTNFINANPGLRSRFTNTIEFEDFNHDELVEVFERFGQLDHYHITEEATKTVSDLVSQVMSRKTENFANGRFMRKIYHEALMNMAVRVAQLNKPTKNDLINILPADIPLIDDIEDITDTKDEKRNPIGF